VTEVRELMTALTLVVGFLALEAAFLGAAFLALEAAF